MQFVQKKAIVRIEIRQRCVRDQKTIHRYWLAAGSTVGGSSGGAGIVGSGTGTPGSGAGAGWSGGGMGSGWPGGGVEG